MSRKVISVDEALFSKNMMHKKIMNDILYYIRRLLKLARQAQSLGVSEGVDIDELNSISEEIDKIEKSLEEE